MENMFYYFNGACKIYKTPMLAHESTTCYFESTTCLQARITTYHTLRSKLEFTQQWMILQWQSVKYVYLGNQSSTSRSARWSGPCLTCLYDHVYKTSELKLSVFSDIDWEKVPCLCCQDTLSQT